jgi:CubicO group peptidase (beta-lactamase class C family)
MTARLMPLCALFIAACATQPPSGHEVEPDVDRPDPATAQIVDRIAQRHVAETSLAGLSVAVARDGRVIHESGYGLARRDPTLAADAHVAFELFSVSMPVTAVLLLRLAERGLVDLDRPVGSYLRELPEEYASSTLRQLLTHTSGIRELAIDDGHSDPRFAQAPSRQDLLVWLGTGERAAIPDETWIYSSAGYLAAGLVAETVTNQSLAQLVREEMSLPLALNGLASCPELATVRAVSYSSGGGATTIASPVDAGWRGGAGALCGTAGDLARWWIAARSGRIISPASLKEWTTPVTLERNGVREEFGYGLGVRLGAWRGHTVIGHTGDGAGGTSVLAEYPDDRLLIVVLANTGGKDVPHAIEIQAAIAEELLHLAPASAVTVDIEPEGLASVPGLYHSAEASFCIEAAADHLLVSTDEEQTVQLSYQGGGRFLRPGDGDSVEYFLGWPDHSEWFGYAWFGLPMDLAAKQAETCP